MDQKLRDKIEAERHLYDFKVIKRRMVGGADEDRVYLTKDEVAQQLRLP